MKLRYADEAVKEIKQIDPSSAVTARMIRSLIKKKSFHQFLSVAVVAD